MFRFASLIAANFFRNRRRSALTVASIAVSLCLLTVLGAMYRSLFLYPDASPSQALRLVTHHRVSITQPMPVAFLPKIRSIPGVRDSMISQWFGGTYKDARDPRNFFARIAVEPDRFFTIKSEVQLPEAQQLAFQQGRTSCIVGRKLAERFQWKIGDRVTLVGDIFPVNPELTIAGIYANPEEEEVLYFDYEYLRQLRKAAGQSSSADEVGTFLTLADRPEDVDVIAAAIDKQFENSPAPTKSETERAWQLSFVSFLGNLKLFLLSISGALTFTILLVSGNTISMSVRERTREVGILKTLGFTQQMVLAIFLGESMLMALAGGLLGIGLGAGLSAGVQASGTAFAALKLGVSLDIAAFVLFVAALIGVLSSFIPAWNASRMSILESLGHAG
ncbi:MAG TPA: FtsX-like permease family protein [Terriglobales bacterium]|jgi:putative ABC transport system permease protein